MTFLGLEEVLRGLEWNPRGLADSVSALTGNIYILPEGETIREVEAIASGEARVGAMLELQHEANAAARRLAKLTGRGIAVKGPFTIQQPCTHCGLPVKVKLMGSAVALLGSLALFMAINKVFEPDSGIVAGADQIFGV